MSTPRDYYAVLGVSRTASEDEIRRAYRKLARRYHPDVSKDPETAGRFAEISQAYEVLSDKEKRRGYDRLGAAGVGAASGGGGGRAWPGGFGTAGAGGPRDVGDVGGVDLSDLFEQMFAGSSPFGRPGAAPPRPAQRGADLHHTITVSFLTAARGGREELRLSSGEGRRERLSVTIPPGIESGTKLRVSGRGQGGHGGGPSGDLIVTVEVGEHPWFRREGLDLLLDLPVTIVEAAFGTTVTVPLLSGTVDLKVPPGTSSGRKLRVRGRGLTDAAGRQGDFYVLVQIVAPQGLAPEAEQHLRALEGQLKNPRDCAPWSDLKQTTG